MKTGVCPAVWAGLSTAARTGGGERTAAVTTIRTTMLEMPRPSRFTAVLPALERTRLINRLPGYPIIRSRRTFGHPSPDATLIRSPPNDGHGLRRRQGIRRRDVFRDGRRRGTHLAISERPLEGDKSRSGPPGVHLQFDPRAGADC